MGFMPEKLKNGLDAIVAERRRIRESETQQAWLDLRAIEKGVINTPSGAQRKFWVVPSPGYARELAGDPESLRFGRLGGLNGYVLFTPRPVREKEEAGILQYVKVHGGITYWGNHEGGVVYGFDTAHLNSNSLPITDPGWVREEIFAMMVGIEKAAEVEAAYLAETDDDKKAAFAQQVCDVRPGTELGYGALISLMSGKI